MELTNTQLEIFQLMYPIFKDEVFRRRDQMMRLTAWASTLLVVILATKLAFFHGVTPPAPTQWLTISGILVFSGLFAYLILQHASRHRMAKQQLIALEQTVGLYQDGWKKNGEAIFPPSWQSDWTGDRSVTIYLVILSTLTALVICAILA